MLRETLTKQSHVLVFRNNKPYTLKINGKPKTWKTRPNDYQIPYKHGLYEHGYIGNTGQCDVSLNEVYEPETPIQVPNTIYKPCPICRKNHKNMWYYPNSNHLVPYCVKH